MAALAPPIRLSPSLRLAIGDVSAPLTPRQGMQLAERLIRTAARRAAEEAVAAVPLERPRPAARKAAAR